MKNAWVSAALHAAHEILYYFPIILLLNHFLGIANLFMGVAAVLLCYMLGFALGRYALVRYLEWLLCMVIGVVVSISLFGLNVGGIVFCMLTTIAVIRGYRFRYVQWDVLFSHSFYVSSICLYFVTPLIFMFFPELKIYSVYLYWTGLYCIIHALFTFNSKQVELASQNTQVGQLTALNVRRANRIGTGVVVIILFITINIDRLLQMVKSFIYGIMAWLNEILSRPNKDQPPEPDELPPVNSGGMDMPEIAEKSLLREILDMIIYYIGYIIVFVLTILFLYFLIIKLIMPMFSRFFSTAKLTRELQVGYLDEEEKIEAPQLGKWFRELIQRGPDRREPQDNRERVRYLYRDILQAAMKRGYEFKRSQTPLEIERNWQSLKPKQRLPSRLMTLYNKARYGEVQITDEEVKKLKDAE